MAGLLKQVNSPVDLKRLSLEQLPELAEEIRQFILDTVSRTGGHLAGSLGVVELTLAMHYVFDFDSDKLLWDVGHQCYTHKILTGRKEGFKHLRSSEGVSGFPNPAESEYDQFTVGHSGTAVASAIGMALGLAHQNSDRKVVALVGDASIVNGVSFEALNNLGLVKRQLLIVLNDNSMAIDATEGAVARYFSRVRLSQTYEDLRRTANNILEHLPIFGKGVEEVIGRIKKSIRMVLPASQMFESLDIPYFGPVDGHNISSLVGLFRGLSELEHPALLHVYTRKGKGFTPAEEDRRRFHSTGPFEQEGDEIMPVTVPPSESYTDAFGSAMVELAEQDERIVAITCAMCHGTGLAEFRERFPERFYDAGIAESAVVDIAAGLAKTGLKPVVCIYSTFLQRSFDQIAQEVSLQNLGVVFCIDRAGLVGRDGPTHHGVMDTGFLRMMPNVLLAAPGCKVEVRRALEFAVGTDSPVCIRYPKESVPDGELPKGFIEACNKPFEPGRAIVLNSSKHSNLAIVSYGSVLPIAAEALERLKASGIAADLINARFAAPVDRQILLLHKQGKGIITVEDHRCSCGFGSAVLEAICASCDTKAPACRVKVIGVPQSFIRHDSRDNELETAGVSVDKIVSAAKEILGK